MQRENYLLPCEIYHHAVELGVEYFINSVSSKREKAKR